MRILGVDPGIATVGFAVLDAEKRSQRLLTCGVITTPAKTQLSSRLDQIYRDLNELIAQFHPEVMEKDFDISISNINMSKSFSSTSLPSEYFCITTSSQYFFVSLMQIFSILSLMTFSSSHIPITMLYLFKLLYT